MAAHIGHAYEVMATDAIARFKRLDGYDVYFQTGTDEHGQRCSARPKPRACRRRTMSTVAALFHQMADTLNISYDRFIRTTEADHACRHRIVAAHGGEWRYLSQ